MTIDVKFSDSYAMQKNDLYDTVKVDVQSEDPREADREAKSNLEELARQMAEEKERSQVTIANYALNIRTKTASAEFYIH